MQHAVVEVRTDEGIEQVYREQATPLWRALVAYSADREIAADAVAEAFAQAIARADAIRDPSRWVWTAAFRIARGELKRRQAPTGRGDEMTSELPELERSADLLRALRTLPHRQRAALVLHYLVDLPTADVASILRMRAGTVRVTLHRGRRRLRELLEEEGS
jgi:RNA polymerase sigma-70 factor (ECF subfamily)